MSQFLIRELFKYSNKVEQKIKLNNLLNFNFKMLDTNNSFKKTFKDDLLIRLAKRTNELEKLPYGLSAMPSINKMSKWYIDSFEELYQYDDYDDN